MVLKCDEAGFCIKGMNKTNKVERAVRLQIEVGKVPRREVTTTCLQLKGSGKSNKKSLSIFVRKVCEETNKLVRLERCPMSDGKVPSTKPKISLQ